MCVHIYLCIYMYTRPLHLFICSSVDGHLDCFQMSWLLWIMLQWPWECRYLFDSNIHWFLVPDYFVSKSLMISRPTHQFSSLFSGQKLKSARIQVLALVLAHFSDQNFFASKAVARASKIYWCSVHTRPLILEVSEGGTLILLILKKPLCPSNVDPGLRTTPLEQWLAKYSPQAKSSTLPVFHWNTAVVI